LFLEFKNPEERNNKIPAKVIVMVVYFFFLVGEPKQQPQEYFTLVNVQIALCSLSVQQSSIHGLLIFKCFLSRPKDHKKTWLVGCIALQLSKFQQLQTTVHWIPVM